MTERMVVGTRPWLPAMLRSWSWLNDPVPAERLAALRIGIGLVLFFDVLLTYCPFRYDYFGPGSLAEPDVFRGHFAGPSWAWSVIRWWPGFFTPNMICGIWLAAALGLTLGIFPRLSAIIAWVMALSVHYYNSYLHNSGDLLRQHLLFFLMLTPCGAAWSLMRPRGLPKGISASVYPWALRLIFLELIIMYFFNGIYKLLFGPQWQSGRVLHHVLHTPGWARWSPPMDLPLWLTAGVTYFVLAWEVFFPVLVLVKSTRFAALAIGASFHLITFFNLEIGPFGLYALCMYLPLLPWERCHRLVAPTPRITNTRRSLEEMAPCVPA
jgi:hypothetical protein